MKRMHKKIIGFFSLVVVIATTVYAAILPAPEASAAEGLTTNIEVRVVSDGPNVDIVSPTSGETTTKSQRTINYNYENVDTITVSVEYTNPQGETYIYIVDSFAPEDKVGSGSYNLDMTNNRFGFGKYVVKIVGEKASSEGEDGDSISFTYIPVTISAEEDEKNGTISAILDYDESNEKIKQIKINLYDKDGNLITPFSPIIVDSPTKRVILPLAKYGIKAGDYILSAVALGEDKQELYRDYSVDLIYSIIEVPDTGQFYKKLNISQTDFLISGLLLFFVVGITGLYIIMRKKKTTK